MISINWFHLLLQRPLVTILVFALVSCSILLILQAIAGNPSHGQNENYPDLDGKATHVIHLDPRQVTDAANRYDLDEEWGDMKSLKIRIEDLKRIKASVSEELKLLQKERSRILKDKATLISKNEKILNQISKSKSQLKQLELDLSSNKKLKAERSCGSNFVAPIVFNPAKSSGITDYAIYKRGRLDDERESNFDSLGHPKSFKNHYQFDLSFCPLTARFSFNTTFGSDWLSKIDESSISNLDLTTLSGLTLQIHQLHVESSRVCMTVIFKTNSSTPPTSTRNNLIINLSGQPIEDSNFGASGFIASPTFARGAFRLSVDLVIPSVFQPPEQLSSILGAIPLQSPIDRKYLASYFGDKSEDLNQRHALSRTVQILQTIHRSSIDDRFLFIYDCSAANNEPCHNERQKMIEMSTFHIIIPSEAYDIDESSNDLIYMALARGTVPVIIGTERVRLPFDEVIDWRRCALLLPSARLPEVHFILRSLAPADVYSLKYAGRRVFENYMATSKQIFDALISVISVNRLNFPPVPIESTQTQTYFPSEALTMDVNCTLPACRDAKTESSINNLLAFETLGPREVPVASPTFRRNFSLTLNNAYDLWNSPMHSPLHLFPSHPNDPVTPSEFKFLNPNQGYRPIGQGLGGSGAEFSEALGGDRPHEQFTIVLLTYERIPLMMKTLERLKGLAYLNKVLVVWNGINQPPPSDLIWPDIGVPITLVRADRNSLNNRFLPYDAIETDAIFSMDDDSPLRADEIVFAFRVWRESRDRIVGFPGRFHAWDGVQNSWLYNSNHSCELSMVLTGGAFFHKYYSYVYSQIMPETIRSIVDKFMNCEDIAMNFLVAHLTRKPPIKVTSRWTFHCSTCTSSLSEDNTHFMERHECLNIFTSIYGYMPLLNTQHRSDSVLFKTRLPRDKQKCFRFV